MANAAAKSRQKMRVTARVLKYYGDKDTKRDEPDEVVELTPHEYNVNKEENNGIDKRCV